MFKILPEVPQDADAIELLLDKCFGEERFKKTVYKVRQGLDPVPELMLVVRSEEGALQASIRYWPLVTGSGKKALLLGPIAVEPDLQGKGVGVALIRYSMEKAKQLGHERIILVGDPEYYERFGFQPAAPLGLELPGPVEMRRFQICPLTDGALDGVFGMVLGDQSKLVP